MNGVVALAYWNRQCYHRIHLDLDLMLGDMTWCRMDGDAIARLPLVAWVLQKLCTAAVSLLQRVI